MRIRAVQAWIPLDLGSVTSSERPPSVTAGDGGETVRSGRGRRSTLRGRHTRLPAVSRPSRPSSARHKPAGIARLRRAWRSKSLVRDQRLLRAAEFDLEAGEIEQVDVAVQVEVLGLAACGQWPAWGGKADRHLLEVRRIYPVIPVEVAEANRGRRVGNGRAALRVGPHRLHVADVVTSEAVEAMRVAERGAGEVGTCRRGVLRRPGGVRRALRSRKHYLKRCEIRQVHVAVKIEVRTGTALGRGYIGSAHTGG